MKNPHALLASALVAAPVLASPTLNSSLHAGLSFDNNVTRAEKDRDIESDSLLQLGATSGLRHALGETLYASFKGRLDINAYNRFDKLSNTRLGLQAGLHFKPGSGYTAIRYHAVLDAERRLYRSDLRDGTAFTWRLGLGKRLTDVVSLRLGYLRQTINAGHSVFDADNQRLYLDGEFRLIDNHAFFATFSYTDGEIVSTTVPTQEIIDASKGRIVRDDAFLDLSPARWAYKLDATTLALKLGDSYRLAPLQALQASLLYYDVQASGNNDYTGLVARVKYFYRF